MKCKDNSNTFYDINTQLVGAYNAENVLAAVAIGNYFGVESTQIKDGLEAYTPQNNRSQLTVTEHNKLIVDAYNANPTSMQAAIQNFAQMEVENKILILGDMLELGEQSDFEHLQIVELLEQKNLNTVYLVGKEFSKTNSKFKHLATVNELIELINKNSLKDSIVLIKGSRGIQLEKIIPFL
jgi:UDP-N-acetylmuramoyl-tripeptide--D-alanyl-D-alanine ligase